MTDTARALYSFYSSFGIPAYVEDNIPDDAVLPYITYELSEPEWKGQASIYARVWYRNTSFTAITSKVDEIKERIGEGLSIPTDTGYIVIYKDNQFAQFQPNEGMEVKVAYLSMILNSFTE